MLRVSTDGKAHLAQTLQGPDRNEFQTVQFDTNGAVTWSARYGSGTNGGSYVVAAEMDNSNNIYVAGITSGDHSQWMSVVKYGPAGNQLWSAIHNPTSTNTYDAVTAMAVDGAGNVYVTGTTQPNTGNADLLTVKFDANGVEQWAVRHTSTESSTEYAAAIQVDASGVYVFGTTYYDTGRLILFKYDHAGTLLWMRAHGPLSDGQASAMKLDSSGNVIVTGSARWDNETDIDFVTWKYTPQGDLLWIAQYTGMLDGYDYPYALKVDGAGNIYVAGYSSLPDEENTSLAAYPVVKYDSNGNQLWASSQITWSSQVGPDSLGIDSSGNAERLPDAGQILRGKRQ
jgi:hypothetical protein